MRPDTPAGPSTSPLDVSRSRGIACLTALMLLSPVSCTSLCHYGASGTVVLPSDAATAVLPTLVEVVDTALKPLGFSDGTKVHVPGGPLGHHKTEPDHDYVDFTIGVPAKMWSLSLPENQVLVRVEAVNAVIYISDLRRDATQDESSFVKTVRESIQHAVQSTYGVTTDFRKLKVTATQCMLASWP